MRVYRKKYVLKKKKVPHKKIAFLKIKFSISCQGIHEMMCQNFVYENAAKEVFKEVPRILDRFRIFISVKYCQLKASLDDI